MAEFQLSARGRLALMAETMPYDTDGVDVTLIRWMLSLTPEERLDELQSFVDFGNESRAANATEPDTLDLRNAS